ANCYYSSSDAAFDDRYQASEEYERVANGTVPLDGGWRVYSSGAGIALGLIMRHFVGLEVQCDSISVDPVIPASLDGLRLRTTVLGRPIEVCYRIKSAGCAVTALALNDQPLAFTTATNPHRRGAAVVSKADLAGRLTGQGDVLTVEIE